MAQICWTLLITLSLSASFIPSVYGVTETEALIAFKQRLTDPDNVLQSWDPRLVNPCTYFHIRCNQDNLVTRVDLGGMRLSGSLAPELGQLSALENLVLNKNSISGTIPAELGNLQKLTILDLGDNKLTGKVPAQIGKLQSLRRAYFSNNNLCWDFQPTPVFVGSYRIC